MRGQNVARLLACEHAVEDGVAANGEVAGGGVRRDSQKHEHGHEHGRRGAARVDDREHAKREQRDVQGEEPHEQARVERRMREHQGDRRQCDCSRQPEQDERAAARPENQVAKPRHEHRQHRGRHRIESRR